MSTVQYSSGPLSHDRPTEYTRLRSLERAFDSVTTDVLASRRIAPWWRCLDIGAGAGSISRWLADCCPDGLVVAADVDIRFLDPGWAPNLRVRGFDVLHDEFPRASFDLIHARMLAMHLPEREKVLARMARWLAPGGWMVIADLDNSTGESSKHPALRSAVTAIDELMSDQGCDARWARHGLVPALAAAGLSDLGLSWAEAVVGDGGSAERFWRASLAQTAEALVERGHLAPDDLELSLDALGDPALVEVIGILITAWGRRPPSSGSPADPERCSVRPWRTFANGTDG